MPALPAEQKPLKFCEVLVAYTHPGLNDTINVSTWMPLDDNDWNGRFMAQGGGGWAAGSYSDQAAAVSLGYASAHTDGGHTIVGHPKDTFVSSNSWGVVSPGNVNLHALQNFAYRSLDEMATIAKAAIHTYYGKEADYSYWQGCSTGGRQGLSLAQRYPEQFNGILAAAPAINWVTFLITEFWPHVVMKQLDYRPAKCELEAVTKAAIEACDEIDGVKDGVIHAHDKCRFDALSVVDQKYTCGENGERKITKEAATIANAVWNGPIEDGHKIWHGLNKDASLTGFDPLFGGLAATECDDKDQNCKSRPFVMSADWIKNWIMKDPDFDLDTVDEKIFYDILRRSYMEYDSLMDSANADLLPFKESGGKAIMWHGLADHLIFPNGSLNYYERVSKIVPKTPDFFRYFEVPGVAHCFGGNGAFPLTAMNSLVNWVEKGKAPDYLDGQVIPTLGSKSTAKPATRPICAWPKKASFIGADPTKAESFECSTHFAFKLKPGQTFEDAVKDEL
ncbi:hypothetical protein DOTSEDRAFT_137481 [Dothistroma septosporum NZE10]|uniref:Carboxylic ester hydrolase n=1 Tax=Dothistroma septosporum (strain NZE10 / CBS 128990) TaxID=675120 RepID=N1PE28_DOTSN|nr:hypothetical protein DOTSEDRAFT_137481 [Dothistroma septosporum NZE10]